MREIRGRRAYVVESEYLVHAPDGDGAPTVLFLHGYGDTAAGFAGVLGDLGLGACVQVFAGGPLPLELNDQSGKRRIGRAWYCYDGDQDAFRDSLEECESYLDGLLDDVRKKAGADTGRLAVVGYSQGAYLAGFYGLRRSPRPAGVALVAGRLKHEFVEDRMAEAQGLPVLVVRGARDAHVPAEADAEGLKRLEAAGARLERLDHPGGHSITPEVRSGLASWIKSVLG